MLEEIKWKVNKLGQDNSDSPREAEKKEEG
jgi:hypothetical protein